MASNALGNNGGRLYSFGSQPVLIDCNFVVDSTNGNGLGINALKGQGVQNVYMHTAETAAPGNPNPASGYALIQLSSNYNRYLGGFSGFVSPVTGSALNIDATDAALTAGVPYIITSVGQGPKGAVTIAPVADVSGSLASTYFMLYDSYGNSFCIWFSVSGVGSPPNLGPAVVGTQRGLQYVQQTILSGATADNITTALALTIPNLASGVNGVYSFTVAGGGTATLTCTSTLNAPVAGIPQDGAGSLDTGFTFAQTVKDTNLQDWQGVGLPKGLIPTVGQSFVATATGAGASTGQVYAAGISGISSIEVIGNANLSLAPQPMGGSPYVGGWILVQFLAPTSSSVTTLIPTAPANGSVVGMSFYVDNKFSPSNVGL